ncbi:MAG: hypothetical protein GY796_23670 [Chloroflexi bacterium]|nr:hypothetical protein [Chloroflexota bacterium]
MPTAPLRSTTPAIDVYVKLAQYPVLCDRIRLRMREELFQRGIVSKNNFEQEVKEQALISQQREGLSNPYIQEDENSWQHRLEIIRDYHTDAFFANNLGSALLDQIIDEALRNQLTQPSHIDLTFNPEIAPWELLFQQGDLFDKLPPPQKEAVKHHLEEIKVVLIKRLMSDHLPFIRVAKNVFTVQDLRWIYERLIGRGKIGGKASGMMLAWKILQMNEPKLGADLRHFVNIPQTYFIGSELIYEFVYQNKLERYVNQKYLSSVERETDYPRILEACQAGEMPDFLVEQLRDVLVQINGRAFIVRSSSLLEDHLDYSFAGKYASVFCPNQASPDDNLHDLLNAIRRIYASTFNPLAMSEREKYDLIDYDERMAIMIQPLVGERHGRYFFPTIVGIGLSENPLHKDSNTRKKEGCLRLIWGFANRVTGQQFLQQSCIIALSHPHKRPEDPEGSLIQATQSSIKVVNLETNTFETIPVETVLNTEYANLDVIGTAASASDLWSPLSTSVSTADESPHYQVTFNQLTKDPKFIKLMRYTLMRLRTIYEKPVELEFALTVEEAPSGPHYKLYVLQCHTMQ